jgi:hypothetical protein
METTAESTRENDIVVVGADIEKREKFQYNGGITKWKV